MQFYLCVSRGGVEVAGEYQCEAVNSVGFAVKRFHVEVTEAPVIASGGEEVDGVGVRLSERVDVSWGGQTLMLIDARKEDTACYTCLATNIAGKHTKHYDLQVLFFTAEFIQGRMIAIRQARLKAVALLGQLPQDEFNDPK
ncbi:hypothetical protein Pcinc_006827 [Petrolisthes cinctipes]|uniref:Immunoglobulin I-set domain-containing protein n=1 Tax=Petrolisthes cinctipes TaxID=88211 RepID=A0AAE1GCF2_PETCI|nr:hypothetical protein Pcinc_006827 [Petrolisthes cinctipes]